MCGFTDRRVPLASLSIDTNGTGYRLTGADRSVRRFAVRSFLLGPNLTARVQLIRRLREGGRLADAVRAVLITPAGATKGD